MNYYKLYLDQVFSLAETMVIKSEYSAGVINDELIRQFGKASVDPYAPETWKYYLNICGEYHPTDTPMMVKSLDTMQNIAFTKQNLITHIATASAYAYGSRYYLELVSQNKKQEALILGILYPTDMTTALETPDMQVISYPKHLVEDNEETLIPGINDWLDKFNHRWNIPAFNITDEMYGTSLLGVMYSHLPALILTQRLRACRTAHAHSYHVREYLASHGMLDEYLDQMTRGQALFFYRNASYIERHSGKSATFEWLIDQVLTARGLPLVEYRMHHDTTSMPNSLTPDVIFKTKPLNSVATASKASFSVTTLMSKEISVARGNMERVAQTINETETSLKYTLAATAKTKVLESSLVDMNAGNSSSIQDTALAMWGYGAATGIYNVFIRVKNPVDGSELALSMLQAYYYFFYAYCQVNSVHITTVPEIFASHVPRWPAPSLDEVLNNVDTKYVNVAKVQALMALTPSPMTFANTQYFQDGCQALYDAASAQQRLVAKEEHFYARGLMMGAYLKLYGDNIIRTADTGQPIVPYLSSLDVPTSGLTDFQWQQLYMDIFKACTGLDMQATLQTSSMQKAMVRLLTQLSSYSIQFVSEVSGAVVQSVNWSAIRFGDSSGAGRSYFEVLTSVIDVFEGKITPRLRLNMSVKTISNSLNFHLRPQYFGECLLPVKITTDLKNQSRSDLVVNIGQISLDDRFDRNAPLDSANSLAFQTMTDAEKLAVANVYTDRLVIPYTAPTKIDLTTLVNQVNLPMFSTNEKIRLGIAGWSGFWGPSKVKYFADGTTIIVLNGIWTFFGEDRLEAFRPTIGNQQVPSFKYVPLSSVVVNTLDFRYTGGQLVTFTFGQGPTPGDVNLGTLHASPVKTDFGFNSKTFLSQSLGFNNQTGVLTDISFTHETKIYQIAFTGLLKQYVLPDLKQFTKLTYMHFDQMPRNVVMRNMTSINITHLAQTFKARQNVWSMLPFKQTFIAQGPRLFGYGVYNLDTAYHLSRDSIFNDAVFVQLRADVKQFDMAMNSVTTKTLSMNLTSLVPEVSMGLTTISQPSQVITIANETRALDFALSVPGPKVIEIPDFQTLFNSLP